MTINQYFRSNFNGDGEQDLMESLIIETIQAGGLDMEYVPREAIAEDALFGEDTSSAFTVAYPIELYVKSVDGFGGDGHFLSKFGLEIRDEMKFTLAKRRFEEEVTATDSSLSRPREGDLIHLTGEIDHRRRLFEITYVDETEVFYQLGKLYTYELTCQVFEYSDETFDTGVSTIDSLETDYSSAISINLDAGTGSYTLGETVTQANSGWGAEVISYDSETDELVVINQSGELDTTENVVGSSSGADWSIAGIGDEYYNESQSDNSTIESESSSFVDFSEDNPFSQ